MHRRDFLRPPSPEPVPFAVPDLTLVRVSRRAMATTFEIALPLGTPRAVEAAEAALDLVDEIEAELTVYRDDSTVSRLNAAAATEAVPVGESLFDLLVRSAVLSRETGGAFDVASGALVKAWGFFRREGRVPTPAERAAALANSGIRHVVLDTASRTVKFLRRGLELNFGAIGKGYALDRAAALLARDWGIRSALLHAGGSSVFALGTPPSDPRGWPIAVRHPSEPDRTLATVRLCDEGFGTSAATFQFFEYNGKKLGHLLDPRIGWPASGTASASCVAPTAAEADARSTAFFVLGASAAEEQCRSRPDLAAILLTDTDAAEPVIIESATRRPRDPR